MVSDFSTDQYKLIGIDLCDLPNVKAALTQAGVNYSLPTLFVSEVSITYMPCDK